MSTSRAAEPQIRTKLTDSHLRELASRLARLAAIDYPHLDALYKHLHSHPELSLSEEHTAARLAVELTRIGFTVTTKIGGHGLVGVIKNGKGPTVLVRCEMDALPVTERTGLPYASKVRTRDRNGFEVGVMHACGHDINMTCWTGTAGALVALKKEWKGTLVFMAEPAEEVGAGARMMLEAGLLKKFPRPDYCLALHCDAMRPYGTVAYTEGLALANVDSVDITVRGKGGHGAAPQTTIDPIVLACRIVLDLQTLVSRETSPADPVVLTVGSIHGGNKHNIIPNEVKLQLTVRTISEKERKHLLSGIRRVAQGAAQGAGAPKPLVTINLGRLNTPALRNDLALVRKTLPVFRTILGSDKVLERRPVMGGEDFARLGREDLPIFIFFIGSVAPERSANDRLQPLPSLHSDRYYPVPEPTIKTGVLAMSAAVLNLLEN